jgi:transcriptional regulator with XRE-family HTH domain
MLGQEIRRRRRALGWTQEDLAEVAGISVHYLSTIENGKRDPSVSTVMALAKALKVSAGELLGGVEGLSPAGIEAARSFERLSATAQDTVLALMRLLLRERGR